MKKREEKEPQKAPKKRKSRAGMTLRRTNLEKMQKQLLNVLRRDVEKLLESSFKSTLRAEETDKLLLYLKQVKTLRKDELEDLEGLSDEALAELAKGKKK